MPGSDGGRCPCGQGLEYAECCGPAHDGAPPATAEALMRSRYTAFARGDSAYLMRSWDPATRPPSVEPDPDLRWTGLEVLDTAGGGLFDTEGEVEFVAHYRANGRSGDLRERSRFVRHDGAWVYRGPTG
jgi:SEC-C motif-containing protein